jgi:hypothetical protein
VQIQPAVCLFDALQGGFEISDLFPGEINIFGDRMGRYSPAQSVKEREYLMSLVSIAV